MNKKINKIAVTQKDLAEVLNISTASISFALKGSPKISETLRAKIIAKAQEMGYAPNPAARTLAHYRKSSSKAPVHAAIAWLNFWPDPKRLRSFHEYDHYWNGAKKAATSMGYQLEEFRAHDTPPARLSRILQSRGIKGILLPPHRLTPEWNDFKWDQFSIIRFGRSLYHPLTHIVTADQVANMLLAFKETQQQGYQRIGFITGPGPSRGALFDAGFLRAQQCLPKQQQLPICSIADLEDTAILTKINQWIKKYKPDAILTDTLKVPDTLTKIGYKVPKDFGLASMSLLDVPVDSGIDQNPAEIGIVAIHTLVGMLSTNAHGLPPTLRETSVLGRWVHGTSLPKLHSL